MTEITFPDGLSNLRISGRNIVKDNVCYLGWSSSFLELALTGTRVTAKIRTDFWDCNMFYGRMAVFINDSVQPEKCFMLENGIEKEYELFSADSPKSVKLRLMKLSEAAFAKVGIISISVDGTVLEAPKPEYSRRIEFIGDSITCGYGVEGVYNVDEFSTETENPLKSYSIKTAHLCKAEYQLVSWSGIGVLSSYVDEDAAEPRNDWLMPPLYPYTDKGLENVIGFVDGKSHQLWDFSRFVPDVIVINLGTNDASWVKDIPERRNDFKREYLALLELVRKSNPDAYIVCTYGMMGTQLSDTIAEAVRSAQDEKITYLPLECQLDEDGIGADWHPSEKTHEKAAAKLSEYINQIFSRKELK